MVNQKTELRNKNSQTVKPQAQWSSVFAMTLFVLLLIAQEFMPVSLLPLMAHARDVNVAMAG